MAETIFTKILAGEVPCYRIYEDTHCLAFLDVAPLSAGHVLLIPKEPAETLDALSDAAAAALGRVMPRLCRAVMAVSGAKGYNVLQNNGEIGHQGVMHVHFHIIPRPNANSGLELVWKTQSPTPERQHTIAHAMRQALNEEPAPAG
jgi:histidine triad (HIT) family protein